VITRSRGAGQRAARPPQVGPGESGEGAGSGLSSRPEGPVWSGSRDRSNLAFVVLIGFAVAVALALRWSALDSQSLWGDEGYTLWISRLSPSDIWRTLALDTSSPLYYILVHYWVKCVGSSAASLRALSALFATLSVPLFYLIARKMLAERTAIWLAMMLYAVSYLQVWYSKEARCYTLLVFLSLGSVYCLLLCLESSNPLRLCSLALFLAASLYTHNMALFYLPGLALMWFVYPAERPIRARVRDALIVFSLVLLLYIPWLPTLRAQHQGIQGIYWVPTPGGRTILNSLFVLSGFDVSTLQAVFRDAIFHGRFHTQRLFGFWTWAPVVLMIFVLCILGALCAKRAADRRKIAALLVYSTIPVVLVFVDSRVSTPVYLDRLFLGCCALLPVLLCAAIAFHIGTARKVYQLIGLFVLVATTISLFGYLRHERKQDWRGATEYLMKLPQTRRLAVTVPDFGQVLVQYYVSRLSKSYPPIEVTGLLARFNPPDPGLQRRTVQNEQSGVALALLSQAMIRGKYKEVDVLVSPGAPPHLVKSALAFLHCDSVDCVEFCGPLEVRRCAVQSSIGD